ncbi:septal ring lytic transglycosylase RlpA family protein [Colwellia sp. MB3u-28]|nr:septal ring lytic transglycosylase RlpA family protein [Colwellia sp. MB02u-7]MBA6234870.1 septal ring lytic transglycosylase RlpA family protein [Colwellia sp. MB02u-11]MBA6255734.1 septal ring lytic transglycosylase RlpA family protein [Colwellia sp. MB3u-28]MBA6261875.1 septal ring lytic transglycosylase RlpA family protein [Colwellia sp. MB3u-41]MBA6301425.1 septal ring lytic transglycosylase RlpA family protein [Colwellia sp. MB3u-22]MBA6305088.1 septal ring lytic transglycosylase RlpA
MNTGRYQQKSDSKPTRSPSVSELVDITPRAEAHSRGGNRSQYQVRGKTYSVLKSAENFSQTGIASWYGEKFHGHLTSNGEIYNMYAMSAAHKNLPLPTYLKVTNNANNRSVIVRVNDRGPFHQNRIIDLSYSAAYKLDMMKTGVANVTVTAITDFSLPEEKQVIPAVLTTSEISEERKYIQVFATKNEQLANETAQTLQNLYQVNTITPKNNDIFRVQMGPFTDVEALNTILISLQKTAYPSAFSLK